MRQEIPPYTHVDPQEGETLEGAVERRLSELAQQGQETTVTDWSGRVVRQDEEPLSVFITVEVPLDVAVRFENARGQRSRDSFFAHLLASYELRREWVFPKEDSR